MSLYAIQNGDYNGWYSYQELKNIAETMPEDGDYQSDSPEAEFVTGYNTDTYADESIDIAKAIFEDMMDETGEVPDWDEFLDHVIDDFDWQLTHTWLRVTNLHITDDDDIDRFGRECLSGTMESVLADKLAQWA